MIKILFVSLALVSGLFSNDLFNDYDITYSTMLHSEYEQTQSKSDELVDDDSSLVSWFNKFDINYIASDNIYLSLGLKANLILDEQSYDETLYALDKQTEDELNNVDFSELTFNYDNQFLSINLGRIDLDYDWLSGSVDGALVSLGDDKKTSLRVFWFNRFTQQSYNSYLQVSSINDNDGLYATILKTKQSDFEFTLYDYYMKDLRNSGGIHINYTNNHFGCDMVYTGVKALSNAVYDYDESLAQISFEYIYGFNYVEVGGSYTGENGLLAMTQMGSGILGSFYMTNSVDRESAKNIYLKYIYLSQNWYFKFLAGFSRYDNSFIKIEDDLESFEIDTYYRYYFTKQFFVDMGIMGIDVDERDPIDFSKLSTTLTLGYKYELF